MDSPFRATADGVEIKVWVTPGSSREGIAGIHGDRLKVWITAPPEGGLANEAVCEMLAGVIGRTVEIARGWTSRSKLLLVPGAELEEVRGNLGL